MSEILDFLKTTETLTDIFYFYNDLVSQVFNIDLENEEFLKQVKSAKFSIFNKNTESRVRNSEINFVDEAIRCSYLLKYSVIDTYCVLEHFEEVCDCCLYKQLKEMNSVRICCFGGGGGVELFAISKAIYEFLRCNSNEEHQYAIKLYFTVIDVCNEWESWTVSLLKRLKKCYKDVIDLRMRFVQADLTQKWGEDVLKAVQKADILTMVKFLSTLNLKECKTDFRENVALEMKLNSWIFFLDYAGGCFYKKMQLKMKEYQYFEQYQECLHQEYFFEKDELDISNPLSSFMYNIMFVNNSTKVSSGTWKKCIPELEEIPKKPKKIKGNSRAQKSQSASNLPIKEMTDRKKEWKIKKKELDSYCGASARTTISDRFREIEETNEIEVKSVLKKSGLYIARIRKSR